MLNRIPIPPKIDWFYISGCWRYEYMCLNEDFGSVVATFHISEG